MACKGLIASLLIPTSLLVNSSIAWAGNDDDSAANSPAKRVKSNAPQPLPAAAAVAAASSSSTPNTGAAAGTVKASIAVEKKAFKKQTLPPSVRIYRATTGAAPFSRYLRKPENLKEGILDSNVGQERFRVFVAKKTRRLPEHEQRAAKFVGLPLPSSTTRDEFKSVYFVRTSKKRVYAASVGGVDLLDRKEFDPNFGSNVRKRVKASSLRRDKFSNLQSSLHPDETRAYKRPAPLALEHAGSHVYVPRSQTLVVRKGTLPSLGTNGDVSIIFNPDSLVVQQSYKVADLPSICNDLDSILGKSPSNPQQGQAVLVEDGEERDELDKELLRLIRKKGGKAQLKWALVPPLKCSELHVYESVGIFETVRTRKVHDNFYPNPDAALEALGGQLSELSKDDIKSLKSVTLRGVNKANKSNKSEEGDTCEYTRGKPHNVYDSFLEARFRYTFSEKSKEYYLTDGQWYVVPHPYSIKQEFDCIAPVSLGMQFKTTVDKSESGNDSEGAFNFRQVREAPQTMLLADRLMIPHQFEHWGTGGQSFEPFDLIDVKNRLLITIKRGTGGGNISHLLWQANIAARRLLDPTYREWTKHFLFLCDVVISLHKLKQQEDFFSVTQGSEVSLLGSVYDLLKKVYGGQSTLKTKDFISEVKKALPQQFPQNQPKVDDAVKKAQKKITSFFSAYDPGKITVVIGFIQKSAAQVTSPSVMEAVYDGLQRVASYGYRTAIAYIPSI